MKLVLARKDFVRCQIISKKLTPKNLKGEEFEELKVRFFQRVNQYYIHEKLHIQTAKGFQTIFDTISKSKGEAANLTDIKKLAFEGFVFYLLISPFSNEQVDLLNIVNTLYARELEQHVVINKFVQRFLASELIPLNEEEVKAVLIQYEPFKAPTENHSNHFKEFIRQIIQHNLRVIEKYYTRIQINRLSVLIGVSMERAETELADMVVNGRITAKINRISGVVNFGDKKFSNDILNDWNTDLGSLLDKIEQTSHLIHREKVVYGK